MSEVHIMAILYPVPGKEVRFKELMNGMIKNVHEKEDYTLRYIMTERIEHDGPPELVMIETYKSKEGAQKHTTEPHFKQLFKDFEKEGLMAKEPYLAFTKSITGFELDHKMFHA